MRVLISGASVAGPALAFWLARQGDDVTIVERAAGIRPGGYAIDFRGTATRVLERMGLGDAVRQCRTHTGSITMVDADDKCVAKLPDGFTSGDLEIQRGAFARILYEATCNTVTYIFNDSITAIAAKANGAEVRFASGETAVFDIVVGADGLHSNVRARVFGDEAAFVRHMGYYIAIYTIPDYLQLGDAGKYHVQRGKRVGCFGTANGQATASFYFASEKLDYDRRDVPAQKALLRETFAGIAWEAQRLLAFLDQATDFYFDSLSQVKMQPWSKGPVVLLGDAASCASPVSGMGTSVALVGAYVLAHELKAAGGNHAAAFIAYETAMRDFVSEAQKMADGSVAWLIPKTRVRLWLSKRLWSWMPEAQLRGLMIEQPTKIASMVDLGDYADA